ncbi:MAG: prolipoprotein diacylglyceryl transferase [Bacilli bacterium]|nr:prolipoprotein diacylglyceryl transferase [Bacilli bacterium]MDD4077015.1 prolipoprotein diacylglyceryl transferase [Bacilli bacterium]MDD4388689.1 prolipoprotein diacylglyceryl transferase [Bacilli bacterium]
MIKRKFEHIAIFTLAFLSLFLIGCSVETYTDSAGNEIKIISREAFSLFGWRNVYWYAIMIITGLSLAFIYGIYIARKIGFNENALFDGFIYGALLGILGARLWYVAFAWKEGNFTFIKIFTGFVHEEGGLAIHGAVTAAGIFAFFFARKRKLDIYKLGEMLAPGFLIGQIFGRWGNFFNQEAHGGPIAQTVAEGRAFLERLHLPKFLIDQMYIDGTYMHPTFLYESVWNLIGLSIILITRRFSKKYWMGDAVMFYLIWYGVGRFFIESIRTDALTFNFFGITLRTAQVVSIIMIIAGITLFILRRIFKVNPHSFIEIVQETAEQKKATVENN